MKTLLILLLISSQLFAQNLYLDKMLHEESKDQAYIGMTVLALTFLGQHLAQDNHNRDLIIATGLSASIAINVNYFSKKRKIRKRFHHKNRSYKFKN